MRKKTLPGKSSKRNGAGPEPERLSALKKEALHVTPVAPRVSRVAAATTKSLMKTSELGVRAGVPRPPAARASRPAEPLKPRRLTPDMRRNDVGRQQKIEERIATATEELASGINEASSAADELRRAMEKIASGAEEAASASQETLAAAANVATALTSAREKANGTRRRTEQLQQLLTETSNQISAWAGNIKQNGERQAESVSVIKQLSQQAANIAQVTQTVGHVSDQTNLLALNAAI